MAKRKRKPSRGARVWRTLAATIFLLIVFAIGTVAGLVAAYARNLPDIGRMADYQPASATRIFARDGTLLAHTITLDRCSFSFSVLSVFFPARLSQAKDDFSCGRTRSSPRHSRHRRVLHFCRVKAPNYRMG
jgi:hypothetical protein